MPRRVAGRGSPEPKGGGSRIVVDDAGSKRPFMRGILIHSLMARGMSLLLPKFQQLYDLEDRAKTFSAQERLGLRREEEEPIWPSMRA